MADNVQKTPIARTLEQFGNRKAAGAIALLGKALPAKVVSVSGSIVTVQFLLTNVPFTLTNIACPIAGPQWARAPTQVGDLGVVFPADVYLGGVSGLGGGNADLSSPGNLSALVFFPIGNSGWTAPDDPNAWVIYGPDGVILRDANSKTTFTLTPTGLVINVQAGEAVTINGNLIVTGAFQLGGAIKSQTGAVYAGDIQTSGNITAGESGGDQVNLRSHTHDGVQSGSSNTGPPNAGT